MPNASTTQISNASDTTGTPIPLSYGYVWATGKRAAYYMTQDTNNTHTDYWRVGMWLLGHGEWDGCNELWINDQLTWTSENDDTDQFHFHRGADSIIGSGMTPGSTGPDQGVDSFWPVFPPAIQPLHYNRIAYYSIFRKQPIANQTNDHQGDASQWTDVNPIGLWRALRTRLFDGNGRMTAYAFNTNPAWHFVDVLLRRKLMVDYNIDLTTGPDDLTAAVRARFDWGSIYESAQYFDEILANGRRRFSGSYAFASQTTLQAVLEQILLCCRSYMQEYAGKIYLICDKPRASIFTFSREHILPGSWQASDRNVHTVANRFIGKFRDVLVPAASQIQSITCSGHAANPVVTTKDPHPFVKGDYVVIGGTETVYDGQWTVDSVPDVLHAGTPQQVDPTTLTLASKGSNYPASVGVVGSMGLMYSRFANRAPEFWHKKNQLARGAIGNGIPRWWNRIKQELDFATSTYDQVSRITRYERDRQLGLDQTPYVTPPRIQFRTSMFAKDANGALACAIQPGDHVTVDATLNTPYAGEYEVLEPLTVYPPTAQTGASGISQTPEASSGEIEFSLGPYDESVFYDTSDTLAAGWPSVPGSDSGNESDYLGIPLDDGMLAIFMGALASGKTFQLPATGFNPSNTLAWAGPAGFKEAGHPMHVIQECAVDSNFQLTLNYVDGEGHIWNGDVNFACIAWRSAATPTVSGAWKWIELTLAGGEVITFGKAIVADGTTIPLPTGYTAAQSFAVAFPHDGVATGNDAHGVAAYVDSSHVVHLNYQDGESHVWHGNASVLVFAWKNNLGTVTKSTNGAATWAEFPVATAAPAAQAFKIGFARLDNGAMLPTVGGDETKHLQSVTSPSSFQIVDHPAHGVGACYLDSNRNMVTTFDDGEGHVWTGGSDVLAALPVQIVTIVPVIPPSRTLPVSAASDLPITQDPYFLAGDEHWSYGAKWTPTGDSAGGLKLTDATANTQATSKDKFKVSPGAVYELSAFFSVPDADDLPKGSAFCFLQFYDANDAAVGDPVKGSVLTAVAPGSYPYTFPSDGFSSSSIMGTAAPDGAAYCLAGIEIDPPGAGESTGSWTATWVGGSIRPLRDASGLGYRDGTTVESLRPAQAGADITSQNTSRDALSLGGVPRQLITPIADKMPAEAGADVTKKHADLLLQNPNFEAGDAGWDLNGWQIVPSGGSQFVFDNLQNEGGNPGAWKQTSTHAEAGGQSDGNSTIEFGIADPSLSGAAIKVTASSKTAGQGSNTLNYRHLGVAQAAAGGSSTVGTLTITVPTPVTTDVKQLSGDITITASAEDSSSTVTAIKIYKDGAATPVASSGAATISFKDAGIYGNHTYTVKAWDTGGNVASVVVNVGFGPDFDNIQTFAYDEDFYIPAATLPLLQGLEFDPDFFTGSNRLFASCQWQASSKKWRLWDTLHNSWVEPTGGSVVRDLVPDVWHTLRLTGTVDFATGTYTYEDLVLDGTEIYSSLGATYNQLADATPKNVQCETQIDLNTTTGTAIMYYDNMRLTFGYGGGTGGSSPSGNTGDLVHTDFASDAGLTATGSPAIDATSAYTTPNSAHFPAGVNYYQTAAFAGKTTIYTRQYIKINTIGSTGSTFLALMNGSSTLVNFYFNSNASISYYNHVTSASALVDATPFPTASWHYLEVKWTADATAGTITVKIDGVAVYTGTALNTGTQGVTSIRFGQVDNSTGWDTNQDNVDVSSTGWLGAITIGGGSVFPTSGVNGSPYYAYLPAGVAFRSAQNQHKINCGPGDVISMACWAAGSSGATGTVNLYILWIDASGDPIHPQPQATFQSGVGLKQFRCVGVAPAGTVYAVCYVECETATTGDWMCGGFSPSILSRSLSDVPDDDVYAKPKAPYINNGVPDVYVGDWSSATAYVPGEEVGYSGNYWSCRVANTNSAPSASNANWKLIGPASLEHVPDGGGRHAAIEVYGDQTINHVQVIEGQFPYGNLNLPLNTQVVLASIAIDISSSADIITLWFTAPIGGIGVQAVDVDGTTAIGFTTRLGLFIGSISGLSEGSHTIYIRFTRDTGSSDPYNLGANTGLVLVQQICDQAGGMITAPAPGRTIVKAHLI